MVPQGTPESHVVVTEETDVSRQWVPLARAMELEGVGKSQMYRRRKRGQYPVEERDGRVLWGIPLGDIDGEQGTSQGTLESPDAIPQGTAESPSQGTHLPAIPFHDYLMRYVEGLRGERDRLLEMLESQNGMLRSLAETVQSQDSRIAALQAAQCDVPSRDTVVPRRWWQFWRPQPQIRVAH